MQQLGLPFLKIVSMAEIPFQRVEAYGDTVCSQQRGFDYVEG